MATPTYLLFALGLLGAADIMLYHTVSHGIRHHPGSQFELVTHALRGPTYALLFLLIPNVALLGWWFVLIILLFIFDLAISIADFYLEGDSRRKLGGLPPGEYVLHILLAILFGALVAGVLYEGGQWLWAPTAIRYQPAAVPVVLRLTLAVMAVLVLVSGIQDARAALRLGRHEAIHD
jgi:phosphatidylglycerophosphate synthase